MKKNYKLATEKRRLSLIEFSTKKREYKVPQRKKLSGP
jgi:hypothetical protein